MSAEIRAGRAEISPGDDGANGRTVTEGSNGTAASPTPESRGPAAGVFTAWRFAAGTASLLSSRARLDRSALVAQTSSSPFAPPPVAPPAGVRRTKTSDVPDSATVTPWSSVAANPLSLTETVYDPGSRPPISKAPVLSVTRVPPASRTWTLARGRPSGCPGETTLPAIRPKPSPGPGTSCAARPPLNSGGRRRIPRRARTGRNLRRGSIILGFSRPYTLGPLQKMRVPRAPA